MCRLITNHSKPIDACLEVPGLPQSATGQSTMFTGVNCSKAIGRHCEGFPGQELRKIISEGNLFMELQKRGKKITFADAYLEDSADDICKRRFKSVTTVMALTVPESIRTVADLENNEALLQDITRETIQDRYLNIPVITPNNAAEQLFRLANESDFTLFEFFQTDVAGHSMDYTRACEVLRIYDRFLATLLPYLQVAGITLVLTSDHGNIESICERGHTRNPVPFVACGPGERRLRERVDSLKDVTPAILEAFDGK